MRKILQNFKDRQIVAILLQRQCGSESNGKNYPVGN